MWQYLLTSPYEVPCLWGSCPLPALTFPNLFKYLGVIIVSLPPSKNKTAINSCSSIFLFIALLFYRNMAAVFLSYLISILRIEQKIMPFLKYSDVIVKQNLKCMNLILSNQIMSVMIPSNHVYQ